MDFQELNNDRKAISAADKINAFVDKGFSTEARNVVNQHAIAGAIALALPLLGLDNIVYAVILWYMYSRLCNLARQSFGSNKAKSFILGFIVNFVIVSLLELACNILPIVGGVIGGAIIGFISIKLSAALYLKGLEIVHGGNVAERYNFNSKPTLPPSYSPHRETQIPLPPPYKGAGL